VILVVGAVLLLVPVVVFVVTATRVAAAQREQRLAALRLVGATRRQAAVVAATETGLAALAGGVLAWAGYEVGRRVVAATLTFQGRRFWVDDVAVSPGLLLLVLVGMPVLAMLLSVATLSRVWIGPLGTSRRGPHPPPTARRALPLAIGLGGQLAAVPLRGVVDDEVLDRLAPLFVILTMIGFVAIGPWLCLLAARGLARISRRVPGLIAARRMAGDPRSTFRAVSGVVLATFSVTYFASLVDPSAARPYDGGGGVLRPGVVEVITPGLPEERVAPLLTEGAVTVRFDFGRANQVVESCAALARVVTLSCSTSGLPDEVRVVEGPALASMPVLTVYIPTDGTRAAEDRVRVEAANLLPNAIIHTQVDRVDVDARGLASLGQLMQLGWYFVLVIAACSLTVGMVAGVLERRRSFALLRASGLRLGELRQVVFLETVAAMLITAAAGVALGVAASYALALFGDLDWSGPDVGVFAMVGAGVLVALVLSATALPVLDAATRHDAVRYE